MPPEKETCRLGLEKQKRGKSHWGAGGFPLSDPQENSGLTDSTLDCVLGVHGRGTPYIMVRTGAERLERRGVDLLSKESGWGT